jgi:hypothetical protein
MGSVMSFAQNATARASKPVFSATAKELRLQGSANTKPAGFV